MEPQTQRATLPPVERTASRRHLRNMGMFASVNDQIDRGNEKHGEHHGDSQAADHRACQRRVLFAARLDAQGHGNQAKAGGERGHQNRAQANFARFDDGLLERQAAAVKDAGEFHDQNAIGDHDARHHDHAHERHYVQGGAGHPKNNEYAGETRRDGGENDERIDERVELRHQNQINQDDSEKQAESEAKEGLVHADDSALHTDGGILRKRQALQKVINLVVDAAKALGARHDVDIHDPPDLVGVEFGGSVDGRALAD